MPSQTYVDTVAWSIMAGGFPATRNIFSKDTALDNFALSVNGVPYPQANYFITDYIPVKTSQQYIMNAASGMVVFFNASKVKVANSTIANDTPFTTPAGTLIIRFQVYLLTAKNTLMLIEGAALPLSYVAFGFPSASYVDNKSLVSARNVALSLQKKIFNVYTSELAMSGYAVSAQTGSVYTSAQTLNYFATPMMMVIPGDYFVSTYGSGGGAFFTIDGLFISGFTNLAANTAYAVPATAYYVRFQVLGLARIESLMVSLGSAVPAGYIPFGGQTATLPWQGKGIGLLGDSITNTGNYIPKLLALTGMILRQNYGVPEQGVRTMANSVTAGSIANMDFISILSGTNDYGGNRRLGSIADARADYDDSSLKSFYFDVFYVLNTLYTLKPTIRVMFSTPLKRGAFESQPVYPAANSAGFTLPQYVQAIKGCAHCSACRCATCTARAGLTW